MNILGATATVVAAGAGLALGAWALAVRLGEGLGGLDLPLLDEDEEAEELYRFQLAHGIVRCPPECDDPEHARLRSRAPRTDA